MSNNIGKKLRDKNLEQYDNVPTPDDQSIAGNSFDHSYSQEQYAKYQAGKSFNQEGIFESPFQNDHFDSKYFGFNAGSVTDDIEEDHRGLYDVKNSQIDFEQLKSKGQSSFGKGAAILTKFGSKTGTNIVGNIVGSLYGVGEYAKDHIVGNETDITTVWDNDVTRGLDDVNRRIDMANSVFVDPTSGVGFNAKTFNEVADAYSFIAGMVLSEMAMQTVGNLAGGSGITTFIPRMISNIGKLGRIFRAGDKIIDNAERAKKILDATNKTQKAALDLGESVEKMSRYKRASDITKAIGTGVTNFGRRTLTTGGFEAGLEARQAKDEVMQNGMAEIEYYLSRRPDMTPEEKSLYRKEHMKELTENAKVASMTSFGINSALLGASRMMQFPQIFGNSFVKFKNMNKILRPELGKAATAGGFKGIMKQAPGALFRLSKNPTTEFMEETLQGVTSNYVKNQFELTLGDRTQGGILTPHANKFADNAWRAVQETYGTAEGRHEGIIGAIVGSIGLPGMRKYKRGRKEQEETGKEYGYKFKWQGGIPEDFIKEKARWKASNDAVASVNKSSISDALAYNKDNAIRTALDVEEEQHAIDTENEVAFEGVRDNRVYRYTMDRMDKGLDEHIDQDIAELEQMKLEDYKSKFAKDDTFSEENMKEEVKNFKEKVAIYKNAYKVVHKRFNENLLRKDRRSKKMIDMLTYAVATEKVQMQYRDALINDLHDIFNGELTKEQLQQFFKTAAKTKNIQAELDDITAKGEANKKEQHLKKSGFDKSKQELEKAYKERVETVKNSDKSEEEKQQELADLDNNHKTRLKELEDKYLADHKPFYANKSKNVRERKKLLEELNAKIEASVSKSMKAISGPAEKLTDQELLEHMTIRQKMIEAANDKHESEALIDRMNDITSNEDIAAKLRKVNEIADRMYTAHKVAKVLYGVNKPDGYLMIALSKVAMAELFEDMSNLDNIQHQIKLSDQNSQLRSDEASALIEEYGDLIDIVKENYKEAAISLSRLKGEEGKQFRKELNDEIEKHEDYLKEIEEKLGISKAKTEQNKNNAKQAKKDQKAKDVSDADEQERNKKEAEKTKADKKDVKSKGQTDQDKDAEFIRQSLGGKSAASQGTTTHEDLPSDKKESIIDDPKTQLGIKGSAGKAGPSTSKPDPTEGATASKGSKQREITDREQSNTLTIAESDPSKKTKPNYSIYSKRFDELLNYQGEDGKGFKDKAPAMLEMLDMNPDWLEKYMKELPPEKKGDRTSEEVLESYKRGVEKFKKGLSQKEGSDEHTLVQRALKTNTPKEMVEVDLDLYTAISFAPMAFKIYDQQIKPKKTDKQEDGSYKLDYNFDESILGEEAYAQNFFFSPDAIIMDPDKVSAKQREIYHEKKAKLDQDFNELKKKYKAGSEKLSRERVRYETNLEDLRNTYINWGHNSYTQFDFRKRLFRNKFFKDNNRYKLIVDHVNLGELQHHNYDPPKNGVAENSPATIGFNPATMTIDDVFVYTNYVEGKANYKRIDGVPLNRLPNNPFPFLDKKNHAASGAIYFKYTDQSGKNIPIKMNTSRLGMENAETVVALMRDFFKHQKENGAGSKFIVSNHSIPFLNGKTMKEAMLFFLGQQKGSNGQAATITNKFSIYEDKKGEQPSNMRLFLGNGQPLEFNSLEDLETLLEDPGVDIKALLSDARFWIDKSYATKSTKNKSELNNEVMKFYFDNGIITHHFEGNSIYTPDSKKSITLSRAESKPVGKRTRKKEPPKENNVLIEIQKTLVSKKVADKKTEFSVDDYGGKLTSELLKRVGDMIDVYIQQYNNENSVLIGLDDMNNPEHMAVINEMITHVVQAAVQTQVDKIKNKALPGMIAAKNHDEVFKIQKGDKQVDILLRMMYSFQDTVLRRRKLGEQILQYKNHETGKDGLVNPFITDSISSTSIARFKSKEDRGVNLIDYSNMSEDLFKDIVAHAKYLKEFTNGPDRSVHLPHEFDSPHLPNSINVKYTPKSKNQKATKAHVATRLVSVDIGDNIRFEDGKIKGGSITMRFQDGYNDKGKAIYTTKYLLKSSEPSESNVSNFIKRIPLPFRGDTPAETSETLNKKMAAITDRNKRYNDIRYDIGASMKKSLGSSKVDMKTASAEDDGSIYIKDLPATTPKPTTKKVDDGPKATVTKTSTSVSGKLDSTDFNPENPFYESKGAQNSFRLLLAIIKEYNANNNSLSDAFLDKARSILSGLELIHDSDLLALHAHYKKKGYVDNYGSIGTVKMVDIKIDKFAKSILETCTK